MLPRAGTLSADGHVVIQAFVFFILTLVFFSMATQEHAEH
jgi:hypothetical protein